MIPVHEPILDGNEAEYVLEALSTGHISGSSGRFIREFEEAFARFCRCEYGIAVSSGSTALHLAVVLSDIKPGDEVLMNACTNIASANAVVMQGGVVVPIDSEPDTWNMDTLLLKKAVTRRTKAIMPVHIYGHPVDMGDVHSFAMQHSLFVIEDCAEAHGATFEGRRVGSLGDVGCFSFYANKVITCGEGGMLVTNRKDLAERARSLRNLAFGEPRFVHQEMGFNYRMTNLQAAVGLAQFENIEHILAAKRRVAEIYTRELSEVAGLRLPVEKDYATNVYWMYAVVVEPDFEISRDELMMRLRDSGVETRTMFCPLNLQPALLKRGAVNPTPCPVAEDLWQNGLYLPSGLTLSEQNIVDICGVVREMECA